MASLLHIPNETNASVSRTARDGRKLTYEMTVLQQPQRARACGSGAKSSADRRPVDPPPVVELKIFEGEARKDITFQHNATFFLFTTLEPARPIATPRGSSAAAAPHPVLTGMPVAGMAYLDRPTQAGYFIFPDLSVRHEGKFRLSFNLYEEIKESKDGDVDATTTPSAPGGQQMSFRLEVKSQPFTVYSAKKFPGLAESTSLSRLVAEQGCRVRIRRDVRMRRRDAKSGGKDFDAGSDDEFAAHPHNDRYVTPDSYHHHERPASANEAKPTTLERRPSSHDLPGYYKPAPTEQQQHPPPPHYAHPHPPPPSASQPSNYSHLQFGAPSTPYQQQQQSSSYPASSAPYYSQPAPQHRPTSSSSSAYNYPPRSSGYPAPQSRPSSYHDSEPNRSRAPSGATYVTFDYPAVDQQYSGSAFSASNDGRATPSGTTQLPPLKTLTESKYEQPSAPSATSPPNYDTYGVVPTPSAPSGPTSGKRSYGHTFDDGHSHGHGSGLHNGARPDAVGQDHLQIECDDGTLKSQEELDFDCRMLSYRRADGSRQQKRIPQAYSN